MKYLIAYDISSPKRLRLVAKVLLRFGLRLEKSVFECDLEARQATMLREELFKMSDSDDTILMYHLAKGTQCHVIRDHGLMPASDGCYV